MGERLVTCPICQQTKVYSLFPTGFDGYPLYRDGHIVVLACIDCLSVLSSYPAEQRNAHIKSCILLAFHEDRVIYSLSDPLKPAVIRNIGHTSLHRMQRRFTEHVNSRLKGPSVWGPEQKEWYSRKNWMYDLVAAGRKPIMDILCYVPSAPFAFEYEIRYICHGIRQGWPLLNQEAVVNDQVLSLVRRRDIDYLHASFADLVNIGLFYDRGFEAFIHTWL